MSRFNSESPFLFMWYFRSAHRYLFATVLLCSGTSIAQKEKAGEEGKPPPVKALLVTGGCNHDYEMQERILTLGIRQRISSRIVEWKVHHQGNGRSDVRIPLFENSGWAEGYDIVVHNYCFPRVHDPEYVSRILAPHEEGIPAVLIHGTLQSFQSAEEAWSKFCGVSSRSQIGPGPFGVRWKSEEHPILKGLREWDFLNEDLYLNGEVNSAVTVLAESLPPDNGNREPLAWCHLFGPGKARVFATSMGNESAAMATPEYLDLITRGFLWAIGDLVEDRFKTISEEDSLPGITLSQSGSRAVKPGKSLATAARASALTSNVADGRLPRHVLDGDSRTYWESEKAGPDSLLIELENTSKLEAIAVEWNSECPSGVVIETSDESGTWSEVEAVGHEFARFSVLQLDRSPVVRSIRISVPSTLPGKRIQIREVAAYERLEDVPAAFLIEAPAITRFRSIGSSLKDRGIRVREPWTLSFSGSIPVGYRPRQIIETSSGNLFVVAEKNADSGAAIFLVEIEEKDRGTSIHTFLKDLEAGACGVWDGEWLYLLEGLKITAYRDTNHDNVADEKFETHRIFFQEEETSSEIRISNLKLTVDGWCHGIVEAEEEISGFNAENEAITVPRYGLVKFRRDGSGFETVCRSSHPVLDFFHDEDLQLYLKTHGEDGKEEIRRLNDLPGKNWKNEEPVPVSDLEDLPENGTEQGVYLASGDIVGILRPGKVQLEALANIQSPFLVTLRIDHPVLFIESEEGEWEIAFLERKGVGGEGVKLDEIPDERLITLLGADSRITRREAVFEIQRRRRNLTEEVRALLNDDDSKAYAASLALLSQIPGRPSFDDLLREAKLGKHPLAFRLLGDRPEVRNHQVFGEITKAEEPRISAAILAAIERSGTNVEGLNDLALSMAAMEEPVISSTARNFLVEKEAADACFSALDDPGRSDVHSAALEVLSQLHLATVAEGIVLRLEKTRDPEFRREGLKALCRLYYLERESHSTWTGTALIDAILQASLTDRRVDSISLLDEMLEREIPISDPDAVASLASENLPMESAAIDLLLGHDSVSADAMNWLGEVARSRNRDPVLRSRAGSLIFRGNGIAYRSAFDLASELLKADLPSGARSLLLASWKQTVCPKSQLTRVLQATKGSRTEEAVLAWISLLMFLEKEPTEPESGKTIRLAIESTLSSGGLPLVSLLNAAAEVEPKEVSAMLVAGRKSADEKVRDAAASCAKRLGRSLLNGKKLKADLSDQSAVETTRAISKIRGDVGAGWNVFLEQGCQDCHNIHGEGRLYGPDIVEVCRGMSDGEFVAAILMPEIKIDSGYGSHGFELTNGTRLKGIVEERSKDGIVIRDSGGNSVAIPQSRVRWEWANPTSIMHDGYEESLTAPELASLKSFLHHLAAPTNPGD